VLIVPFGREFRWVINEHSLFLPGKGSIFENKSMFLDRFETERLIIRKLTEEDSLQWLELFKDKQPYEFTALDAELVIGDHL